MRSRKSLGSYALETPKECNKVSEYNPLQYKPLQATFEPLLELWVMDSYLAEEKAHPVCISMRNTTPSLSPGRAISLPCADNHKRLRCALPRRDSCVLQGGVVKTPVVGGEWRCLSGEWISDGNIAAMSRLPVRRVQCHGLSTSG